MTDLGDAIEALIERKVAEEVERRMAGLAATEPRWLDAHGAADHLSMPLKRVRTLTAAAAIPHIRQGGRRLYDRHALDRWMEQQAEGPFR